MAATAGLLRVKLIDTMSYHQERSGGPRLHWGRGGKNLSAVNQYRKD